MRLDKAFIVKEHWGKLILDGTKPWEIRGASTQIRGRVGVIFSGTSLIHGCVELVGSSLLLKKDFEMFSENHRIPGSFEDLPYVVPHIWYLKNAIRFAEPIPYIHPHGAVIWVNLKERVRWRKE